MFAKLQERMKGSADPLFLGIVEEDFKSASFINHIGKGKYLYKDIFIPFAGGSHQNSQFLRANFCDNLAEVISCHIRYTREEGDEYCQLTAILVDGTYIYLQTSCHHSGFIRWGDMKLYADKCLLSLATFAMDGLRQQFLAKSAWLGKKVKLEAKACKVLSPFLIPDLTFLILSFLGGL